MTAPTLIQLDQAVIDCMKALAVARQTTPPDSEAIVAAREALVAARAARGYASA